MKKMITEWLLKHGPKFIRRELMMHVVKCGYNTNEYNDVYRKNTELTPFELKAFKSFLNGMEYLYPEILDIGCGAGVPYDVWLEDKWCHVTGIDISEYQIKRAKENVPTARYICKNFLDYNGIGEFDGIIMLYSLFHIPKEYHKAVMQRVYDLLNDDGRVLITIRRYDSGDIKYKDDFCGQPMAWSHYDSNSFLVMCLSLGFGYEIIGDEHDYGSSENHIWVILKKGD